MTFSDLKRKDQELYEHWKQTGDKKALSALITQLSPLLYSEVRRQEGTLPSAALSAEAKRWAYKAIETYDPTKGTTISTHVVTWLPKVRRINYKYQNAARLPENVQLKFHLYNKANQDLLDKLNRDPTEEEMATELGWSKGHVVKFKNSLYADLIESAAARPDEFKTFDQEKILFDHIISHLDSTEKFILYNAKGMPSADMAVKLGVNVNRLNYLKSKLTKKIDEMKREIGYY